MRPSTRQRLVAAAYELFGEQGFDATTVEQIAERADTGRTTFFRHFASKEAVVFPDHDALLAQVEERLARGTTDTWRTTVKDAAGVVLNHYLAEGETAIARYRLTSVVPALRDREAASVQRYLRLFCRYINRWVGDGTRLALEAELDASAVITAHNHVLRAWLQGIETAPRDAFNAAVDKALDHRRQVDDLTPTVVVIKGTTDLHQVITELRHQWPDRSGTSP